MYKLRLSVFPFKDVRILLEQLMLSKKEEKDMIIDPDKKVEEAQKKAKASYQSKQHPKHFEAEGGEYIENKPNNKDVIDTMPNQMNEPKEEKNN